jgi:hypothetical protein
MPFRHGYKRKRYVKPTRSFSRTKFGYRKFAGKASSVRTRKPARFGFSRRAYRLNTAVARTIRGMAETKIIPFRQNDFSQPTEGPTGIGMIKYITGATALPVQYDGYTAVQGFQAPQGDGKNNRDGQFIFLKHSTVALTVQMDSLIPAGVNPSAVRFRVIVFKNKRAMDPAGATMSPNTSLFLQNNGNNMGDATTGVGAMNNMDMMLQPLNTNNFTILKDTQFTLQHSVDNLTQTAQTTPTPIAQTKYPSCKVMRLRFNHNTKARIPLNATDEPVDYNYRFAVAVYAFWPNGNATVATDTPLTWSASIRGTPGS